MPRASLRVLAARSAAVLALAGATSSAPAGTIGAELERAMAARGSHADTAVIVRFVEPVDLAPLAANDRRTRDHRVLLALKARAAQHRAAVEPLLAGLGAAGTKDLWIVNGIATSLPAVAVRPLAAHALVARIDLDAGIQGGRTQRTPPPRSAPVGPSVPAPAAEAAVLPAAARSRPGWNIDAVHAPALWALGHRGHGVVVATMDTGVDPLHPDLRRRWRGGANSWFDPHGEEATPYDALGHGTQALGVILGGSALGVAPEARWIGVKLYNRDGRARLSDIHRAFQWLMDPGGDAAGAAAPDIVNASWALTGRSAGTCIPEFADDVAALRSAGIAVVFAAGNDGPAARSSNSPANNAGVLSVGALDRDLTIARASSRGPSACTGERFPRLVAPGLQVRTTDLSHGGVASYTTASGSSLAAPHVAGVLALLAGAFPGASVTALEAAVTRTARDLGEAGDDDTYGTGLVDALAAYQWLRDGRDSAATAAAGPPQTPP